MVGLSTLVKLAKGDLGEDELAELLSSVGMDVSFKPVELSVIPFGQLHESASLPTSKLVELRGRMKTGQGIHALLVIT